MLSSASSKSMTFTFRVHSYRTFSRLHCTCGLMIAFRLMHLRRNDKCYLLGGTWKSPMYSSFLLSFLQLETEGCSLGLTMQIRTVWHWKPMLKMAKCLVNGALDRFCKGNSLQRPCTPAQMCYNESSKFWCLFVLQLTWHKLMQYLWDL